MSSNFIEVCIQVDADAGEFDVIVANVDNKTPPRFCGWLPQLLKI
jgi:hypothetical protein